MRLQASEGEAQHVISAVRQHLGLPLAPRYPRQSIQHLQYRNIRTVAKRFLIAQINRLVEENQQLKQFKEKYHELDKKMTVLEKYHELDKKVVVLKETIKPFRRNLFLSSACLIAGAAGIGAAPSFLSLNSYGWYVFVSVSVMLLIAGIAARVEGPAK